MRFEWDDKKDRANLESHKMGFEEACELWLDPNRIEFALKHAGERRWATIARHAGALWFAVFTKRDGAIRLISVRRAVGGEVSLYDQENS